MMTESVSSIRRAELGDDLQTCPHLMIAAPPMAEVGEKGPSVDLLSMAEGLLTEGIGTDFHSKIGGPHSMTGGLRTEEEESDRLTCLLLMTEDQLTEEVEETDRWIDVPSIIEGP